MFGCGVVAGIGVSGVVVVIALWLYARSDFRRQQIEFDEMDKRVTERMNRGARWRGRS